jgi:CxxC motif-containing protein (DUF1111 family)
MLWKNSVFATGVWGLALAACSAAESSDSGESTAVVQQSATVLGGALAGTDATAFAGARDLFAAVETINDGVGPIFNGTSCGACHSSPVVGGSGAQIERRFGRVTSGVFFGFDRAPEDHGGTLRQLLTNGTYTNGSTTCTIPLEKEPATANVNNVGRRSTALFGMGLVDAMPDSWFDQLAAGQPAPLRGVVQRVTLAFPDPRDATQTLGGKRVGRFGHKGQVPGLLTFSADAYLNEMGITTQSCYKGTSILAFANENYPNNIAPPAGCNGGDLAPANPTGNPQVPQFTDDAVGSCDGGRTEIQDDVNEFLFFMERLAPPAPLAPTAEAQAGAQKFEQAGCVGCHTPLPFVTPANPFNGVPGNLAFRPFSDFLAHDMGSLGDGIGNTGDSVATTRLMRTAPLWGARYNSQFLHDGRAPSIQDAILAHDGQAKPSRDVYAGFTTAEKNNVVAFIRSL